jgi:hypothetical protein
LEGSEPKPNYQGPSQHKIVPQNATRHPPRSIRTTGTPPDGAVGNAPECTRSLGKAKLLHFCSVYSRISDVYSSCKFWFILSLCLVFSPYIYKKTKKNARKCGHNNSKCGHNNSPQGEANAG